MRLHTLLALSLLLPLAGFATSCSGRVVTEGRVARPATIEVEVYDRFDGRPLEGALVRVVSAWHERNGLEVFSPFTTFEYATDATGYTFFDAFDFADYEVGFRVDLGGQAVLPFGPFEDEVLVTLEVRLPGEAPLQFDVAIDWGTPALLVEVDY